MTDRADMSGHFTHFVRRRKRLEGRTDTDMCLRTCPLSAPDRGEKGGSLWAAFPFTSRAQAATDSNWTAARLGGVR